jgi:hypothetical protein
MGGVVVSWIPGWGSIAAAGWWSGFFFWASIVSLIGLGISEVASHRYGDRKDELTAEQQRIDKKTHDDEIARLHLEPAQANERAAKLQEAAAWRILQPGEKSRLIAALKTGIGGSIELSYSVNDPESLFLASQFETVFKQVNEGRDVLLWNVKIQPRQFSQAVYWGLHIVGERADLVASLRAAFTVAGVPYSTGPVSYVLNDAPGLTINGSPPDAMIFVGSKHPPN